MARVHLNASDAQELDRVRLGVTDLIGAIESVSLSSPIDTFTFLLETLSLGSPSDGSTQ